MASRDHVVLLKQGVAVWNQWRIANSREKPDLSRTQFAGADLAGVDLAAADLIGADLSQCALTGANFTGANLTGVRLTGADITGAGLSRSHLSRSDLREADLTGADLGASNLDRACLTKARLDRAGMRDAHLGGAHLGGASLRAADLRGADLSGADLKEADLSGADLSGSDLSEADLRGARLCATLLNGARLTAANLSGANLAGAVLRGADLSQARMTKADLRGADLSGARVHDLLALDLSIDEKTNQSDLIMTQPGQSTVTVDGLELAEFTSLLFDNEGVRGLIDTIATRVVLVLGRFSGEKAKVRSAIREGLRRVGFTPVFFDAKLQGCSDASHALVLLLRMARFVILDITDHADIPSGFGEALLCAGRTPVLPLRAAGSPDRHLPDEWHMFTRLLDTKEYEDGPFLSLSLTKVIEEAETAVQVIREAQGSLLAPLTLARRKEAPPRKGKADRKSGHLVGL